MVPPMPSDPELHCGLSGAKNAPFRCAENASFRCAEKRSDCQDRLGTSFNGALTNAKISCVFGVFLLLLLCDRGGGRVLAGAGLLGPDRRRLLHHRGT
eukprot:COSAG06_NODE_18943_length_860_cov_143.636005_1_plen_97_part_01